MQNRKQLTFFQNKYLYCRQNNPNQKENENLFFPVFQEISNKRTFHIN